VHLLTSGDSLAIVDALLAASCGRFGFALDGDGGIVAGDGGIRISDGNRPDIMFDANVVFVTAPVATPGTFGDLSAADVICQSAADNAALPGTYVAWLSTTATNAIDRLSGSRGWVRTDGTPFADQPADIAAGTVWSPISLAADGSEQAFSSTAVVTGTTATGAVSANCADWTVTTGSDTTTGTLTATDAAWTAVGTSTFACAGPSRLYCFGVGKQSVVAPPAVVGRRAFYSRPVGIGGGISAFDAKCQTDADTANLGAPFHAFVATTTANAISRFDTSKSRWVRLDGVPLAPSAADLATGFRVPLNIYADGSPYAIPFGASKAWTGAVDPVSLGVADTCVDWTSTSPSGGGAYGRPTNSGASGFYDGSARRCDEGSYGVYCLEL
jgi:hypothetical protein